MASLINVGVDAEFPVAGKDNNTQGFRDNFSIIKNSLIAAKSEITELQEKAILKSQLGSETGPLVNNLNRSELANPHFTGVTLNAQNVGTVGVVPQQNVDLEFGAHYYIFNVAGDTEITLTNFPGLVDEEEKYYSVVRVELRRMANGAGFVRFLVSGADAEIFYAIEDNVYWDGARRMNIGAGNPRCVLDIWTTDGKKFYVKVVGSSFQI